MGSVRDALEAERTLERDFVEHARTSETAPKGWPAALIMFHLGMWRERLRNALATVAEGREYTPPHGQNIDEINDAELANGIGTPLADAAARSDRLLSEIIELHDKLGDRPFEWHAARTTTEAVLRNSYIHPRNHLFAYYLENGEEDPNKVIEEAEAAMRGLPAPAVILGAAIYNLAGVKARQGKVDEALRLLKEAFDMRSDLRRAAVSDPDLEALRGEPGFAELTKS